jgi:hypothetical protein
MPWPPIPDFTSDPTTFFEPLRALKMVAEMVTGQRKGSPVIMARLFKTATPPGAANSSIKQTFLEDGDLWIDVTHSAKLNYWNAALKIWVPTT